MFLQVVVYKLVVFVFKGLELDIVANVIYRRKVDSLTLLLLPFVDLLTYICYIAFVLSIVSQEEFVTSRRGLITSRRGM